MENVLLGVAVALFIIGVALGVVAGVMFVQRNVMDSIRFLQGKRMTVAAGGKKKSSRTGMLRHGRGGGKARVARPAGDDRSTDVPGTGPGDDSPTAVVSAGQERGDDRPTTIKGSAVVTRGPGDLRDDDEPRYEESELPTEILAELDDSEQPTGVLSAKEEDAEDSERPTGVLGPDEAAEDSERPTGVLTEAEEESERPTGVLGPDEAEEAAESERPTGVLTEEPAEEEESERPTGVLDEAAEEPSEAPTTLLASDDAGEPSEAATGVLGAQDAGEESEAVTGVLGAADAGEESERATGLFVEEPGEDAGAKAPTEPEPAPGSAVTTAETETPEGVAQQDEPLFRFILKQNVMVVHTKETLDEH